MIRAFSARVNGFSSPVVTMTTTSEIGFFLRVRGLCSGILPRPKALACREAAMPVCRDVHDPRPVVLPSNVLQLHRGLAASLRIVIGAEDTTVIRYEDERIALPARRAPRIRRKQCGAAGAFVVEPPLRRSAAICVAGCGTHAAVPGVSLRRL